MSNKSIRKINVFISSPGDVKPERQSVARAIKRINNLSHIRDKYVLTPLAYEEIVPGAIGTSPQSTVNKYMIEAQNSDILICILWSRMGTPVLDQVTGKTYQSGTEYEFIQAYEANQKSGKPYILLYRGMGSISPEADLGQANLVREFFKQFEGKDAKLKGMYKSYHSLDEFEDILLRDIDNILSKNIIDAGDEDDRTYQTTVSSRGAEKISTKTIHNLGNRPLLVGRENDIWKIIATLSKSNVPLIIDGRAGIGKTALAIEIGYYCADKKLSSPNLSSKGPGASEGLIFNHVLYFTARQSDLSLLNILDGIGKWTENIYILQLPDLESKRVEVVKLLSKSNTLIIIDNYESITDIMVSRFVNDVPYPSRVLITSREHHKEIKDARYVSLGEITPDASTELIKQELANLEIDGESYIDAIQSQAADMLDQLLQYTKGTPLAIQWSVGQLQEQSLEAVLQLLAQAEGDLFANMFERSWATLNDSCQKILCILTLFASPPNAFSLEKASKFDDAVIVVAESLKTLVSKRLIEINRSFSISKTRYGLHPLAKSFASVKLEQNNWKQGFRKEIIEYYLNLVRQYGGRDWEDAAKFQVLEDDRENIFLAIQWAFEYQQWENVIEFAEQLRNYTLIFGYWPQRIKHCKDAAFASDKLNNRIKYGRFYRHIGWTLILQGRLDDAEKHLQEALTVAESSGDSKGIADANGDLAELARLRKDYETSRQLREKSLAISMNNNNPRDIYVERTLLAQLDLEEGKLETAKSRFKNSLEDAKNLNWHRAIAYCLHWLGDIERLQSNFNTARAYYEQSRAYLESFQDKSRLAMLEKSFAFLAFAENDREKTEQLGRHALDELKRLGLRHELPDLEELLINVGTSKLY